ncbi:TPA: MFS transporter, partial [Legionella pneumophila]
LLPIIILEHLVASFCLNISAYFKKVNYFQYEQIGEFISCYYWGCLFGSLIGGALTLYYKTSKISGWGLMLLGACLFGLMNSISLWLIAISMFLVGFIGTITATANLTSLIRSVKDNEKLKLKVISLDLIIFNLCFSFVTFVLLDLSPLYILKYVQIMICLLVFVGIGSLIFYQDSIFNPPKLGSLGFKIILPERKQEFMLLMSMVLFFGLIFSMVKVVFAPTLIERFGSNMMSVIAASINPWVVFLIQPLIVGRIKNSNSIWFLGIGGLIVGLSYFMFGMVNSFELTAIVLVLLTFGEMMFGPLSKHFNIQLYRSGQEGVATGIWRAVFLGSGAIGPGLSGYVAEYYGTYVVWDCCALLGLLCFVFSLYLRKIQIKMPYSKLVLDNQ